MPNHYKNTVAYIQISKSSLSHPLTTKEDSYEYSVEKKSYPYIASNPEIANGTPVIEGTRITVRCIAGYYQMGMDADEILYSLSHLTSSQVHSALAYYFDHQDEIDRDLEESSDENHYKQQVLSHPKQKN